MTWTNAFSDEIGYINLATVQKIELIRPDRVGDGGTWRLIDAQGRPHEFTGPRLSVEEAIRAASPIIPNHLTQLKCHYLWPAAGDPCMHVETHPIIGWAPWYGLMYPVVPGEQVPILPDGSDWSVPKIVQYGDGTCVEIAFEGGRWKSLDDAKAAIRERQEKA